MFVEFGHDSTRAFINVSHIKLVVPQGDGTAIHMIDGSTILLDDRYSDVTAVVELEDMEPKL